jgi:glyoxylase-like metal-dependent hydrolase (beta-lactamase superfamily II)
MELHPILAGNYWTDAGAFLGVLPYYIWKDKVTLDDRHRINMNLNLLLIQTEGRNILIDTGIGNRLNKRRREIYNPSEFMIPTELSKLGLQPEDITDVIMTHLHFDHAGGIVTEQDGIDVLTFPNAVYHIQSVEWQMAKEPDKLNKAAYQFEHQLALLEQEGKIQLIVGDAEIAKGVKLILTGGHSVGSQSVEIIKDGILHMYAGDIIPTSFHLHLAITSGYEVCREQTVAAKQIVYDKLKASNGFLYLDHDVNHWVLPYSEIAAIVAH